MQKVIFPGLLIAALIAAACSGAQRSATELTPEENLGKNLFFDSNLSDPPGQACATCHARAVGWSGPDAALNKKEAVYRGALAPRSGNRKPPLSAYAGFSPALHRDEEGTFIGGLFWDGRATGWELGDPLAEQAMGPFLDPLEQNAPDKAFIVKKVQESAYAALFEEVWGKGSLDLQDVDRSYERIARSIAAYERSREVNPFSSRFDDFWRAADTSGLDVKKIDESNWNEYSGIGLSEDELKGLMLFNTKGLCSACHTLDSNNGGPPLLTDFTYDNLGAPRNPDNPFYVQEARFNPDGTEWIDPGLGGFLETTEQYREFAAESWGKHKVPTLRNVDKRPMSDFTKAFLHNGFFKSLKEVVRFYNLRDTAEADWPEPEVASNVNTEELGDLGLTPEEEDLIVLFMITLTDR